MNFKSKIQRSTRKRYLNKLVIKNNVKSAKKSLKKVNNQIPIKLNYKLKQKGFKNKITIILIKIIIKENALNVEKTSKNRILNIKDA